jgi:hypothetical protein
VALDHCSSGRLTRVKKTSYAGKERNHLWDSTIADMAVRAASEVSSENGAVGTPGVAELLFCTDSG